MCESGSGYCVKPADNTTETGGEISAMMNEAGADTQGRLSIRPDGRWTCQQRMFLTQGGRGDWALGPSTDHQIAHLGHNREKDRDVLSAACLAVEADILHAQGHSQHVQSIPAWAQSLTAATKPETAQRRNRARSYPAQPMAGWSSHFLLFLRSGDATRLGFELWFGHEAEAGLAPGPADADIEQRVGAAAWAGKFHHEQDAIGLAGDEGDRLAGDMVRRGIHTENKIAGADGVAHDFHPVRRSGRIALGWEGARCLRGAAF